MGDTVIICDGTYSEGSGQVGSNAVTITKSLTIKGAGADKVTIRPTRVDPARQIASASPDLRDGVGSIIAVNGAPATPITVDISGVTVSGGGTEAFLPSSSIWNGEFLNGVYAEAGVSFLDAGGSLNASRVTNIVTSNDPANAEPGGYRSNNVGWGVTQVTAAGGSGTATLPISLIGTRIDRYNKGGLLVSGSTGDTPPLTRAGTIGQATVTASSIIGRNLNYPANDGTAPGTLVSTGAVFGQDGIQVTSGSTLSATSNLISQNLMAGTGTATAAAIRGAAGIRLIDIGTNTVATKSNILYNGYGIINLDADGVTDNTTTTIDAPLNYWGMSDASGTVNTGPAVSPAAVPAYPGNPVNGAADVTYGSNSVHFLPFRSGPKTEPGTIANPELGGQWPQADAPIPVADSAPTSALSSNTDTVAPGGTLTLTAHANDDFGVKSVTFYKGATPLGTVVPPNDSITWDAPPACGGSNQSFSVTVVDSNDQSSSSSLSVAIDDCDPAVSLSAAPTAPLGTIRLSADASDDLGLASLDFYVDGDLIHTVSNPDNGISTYDYVPETLCGADEFGFEVVATDSTGHQTADSVNYSKDDCDPVVTLAANHASVAPGGAVDLIAEAEDDVEVAQLTFFKAASQLASYPNTDHTAAWVKVHSTTASNLCGTTDHFRVVAEDNAGQTSEDTVDVSTTACPDNPPTIDLGASATTVDPGDDVTLTANASDDHGVSSITFFEGATQIGQITPPANSIVWTAPETCDTSYTLKAVARDTANQTTEDTVMVTVNACPPPAEPTVSIDSPPAQIAQNGTTVSATATSGADVSKVTFFLGIRQVCEDTSAPFSCKLVPNGDEVGAQPIKAVVTDSLGRTAEDNESTTVSKFKPKGLSLSAKRIGSKKRRIKASGKLMLPARMTAADGCSASRVAITAKLGKKSLVNKQVKLASNCSYSLAFGAPKTKKKQRVVIKARFAGNDSLSATSQVRKVR